MIRVPCVCGKTYRVPPAKAGRKLQCRRCGATQRIPNPEEDEDLLVPFEVLESDEGPLGPAPREEEPALQLADEEREERPRRKRRKTGKTRKPGSKTKKKRKKKRRAEPQEEEHEQDEPALRESSIQAPERSALRVLARLARTSWWALTPAGLVWGPFVALQARGLDKRLGGALRARSQLHQVLLTAWTGALLWGLVAVFGALRVASTPATEVAKGPQGSGAASSGAGQGTPDVSPGTVTSTGPTEQLRDVSGEAYPLRRFLVLAWEVELDDPGLRGSLDAEAFEVKLGSPLNKTLATALNDAQPSVRRQALRVAQRTSLRVPEPVLTRLSKDPDYAVRRTTGGYLRAKGDEHWARTLLSVATSDATLDAALAREEVLAATANSDSALEVLRGAGDLRRAQGRTADEPLLAWPQRSLPNAAAHLADPGGKAEAYAVLYASGGSAVDPLLAEANRSTSAASQRVALTLLAKLAAEGVCPLRVFLDTVSAVGDASKQSIAMQALTQRIKVPNEELTSWILDVLRRQPGSSLAGQLAPLLAPIGFAQGTDVGWLVRDLTLAGDHKAVLKELHSARRAGDPMLDKALRKTWTKLREPTLRVQVLELAHNRLFPDSLEVLLSGLGDREATIRAEAARLLVQPLAPEPEAFRKKASQVLASRLRSERDEQVLPLLYLLATGGRFGWLKDKRKGSDYELSNSLREALRQNARKGSVDAVRVLGSHPSEKTLKVLIDVLDRSRDPALRLQVLSALNRLSGWRKAIENPSHWKESLQPLPESVQKVLLAQAEQDRRERDAIAERSAARLAEAEAKFAAELEAHAR